MFIAKDHIFGNGSSLLLMTGIRGISLMEMFKECIYFLFVFLITSHGLEMSVSLSSGVYPAFSCWRRWWQIGTEASPAWLPRTLILLCAVCVWVTSLVFQSFVRVLHLPPSRLSALVLLVEERIHGFQMQTLYLWGTIWALHLPIYLPFSHRPSQTPEPLSKYLQQPVTNVPSFTKLLFAVGISLPSVCSASTDGATAACATLC